MVDKFWGYEFASMRQLCFATIRRDCRDDKGVVVAKLINRIFYIDSFEKSVALEAEAVEM